MTCRREPVGKIDRRVDLLLRYTGQSITVDANDRAVGNVEVRGQDGIGIGIAEQHSGAAGDRDGNLALDTA